MFLKIRLEYNLPPSKKLPAVFEVASADLRAEMESERACFALLARVSAAYRLIYTHEGMTLRALTNSLSVHS